MMIRSEPEPLIDWCFSSLDCFFSNSHLLPPLPPPLPLFQPFPHLLPSSSVWRNVAKIKVGMCSWISVSGRNVGAFLMSPLALAGAGTSCGRWRRTAQWNSDHHELLHAVTKQSFVDLVNRQWTIGRKYGRNTRSYRRDIQRTIFTTTTAAMDEPKYTCTETCTCSATTAAVFASAVTTHTTAKSP